MVDLSIRRGEGRAEWIETPEGCWVWWIYLGDRCVLSGHASNRDVAASHAIKALLAHTPSDQRPAEVIGRRLAS